VVDDGGLDFGDLDEDLDGFDPDSWVPLDEGPASGDVVITTGAGSELEPAPEEDDPMSMIGSALGALVGEDFVPHEDWARWMVVPAEDPDGALLLTPNRKVDMRQFVPPSDLEFLRDLGQIATMFGAEGVASKMATIVHGLAEAAQKAGAKPLWRPTAKKKAAKTEPPKAEPPKAEESKVDAKPEGDGEPA
jgi:hypothetical protein